MPRGGVTRDGLGGGGEAEAAEADIQYRVMDYTTIIVTIDP